MSDSHRSAGAAEAAPRWAWVEIDPTAITRNVRAIGGRVAPAEVWAVVKADGYGHGAVTAARAALAGGATGLCVALVQEGVALRSAGIDAPVMVLSEQPPRQMAEAIAARLQLTVYSASAVTAAQEAATAAGVVQPLHLKIDTGMHRVGCSPADAVALSRVITDASSLRLASVFTHMAIADVPGDPYTARQLAIFQQTVQEIRAAGIEVPVVHAANSAGALAHLAARLDLVRLGIAMYGLSPGADVADFCGDLLPALSLHAKVSFVKRVPAGERISYGLRHRFDRDTTVATLPIGYADGVPRRLSAVGAEVLVGGLRRPIVGVVTMDQLMIDLGDAVPGVDVSVGDEAVLIGRQGGERVTADDWADQLGTIGYEIVCGLSARLPRLVAPTS